MRRAAISELTPRYDAVFFAFSRVSSMSRRHFRAFAMPFIRFIAASQLRR